MAVYQVAVLVDMLVLKPVVASIFCVHVYLLAVCSASLTETLRQKLDVVSRINQYANNSWAVQTSRLESDVKRLVSGELYRIREFQDPDALLVVKTAMGLLSSDSTSLPTSLENLDRQLDLLKNDTMAYPVTRRLVMLSIIPKLAAAKENEELEKLFVSVCAKLHRLHTTASISKAAVEFFHISKSGGTSLCQLGQKNGCKTEHFDLKGNCIIRRFFDLPRWTVPNILKLKGNPWCAMFRRKKGVVPCHIRKAYLASKKWNFYANEFVMHNGISGYEAVEPCEGLVYIMVFRDPEDRLVSHMHNVMREYQIVFGQAFFRYFNPHSRRDWEKLAPAPVNNYYVRSLLGEQTYSQDLGSLNQVHLDAARLVVLQLDMVITLEDPDLNNLIFKYGLGWEHTFEHVHARESTQKRHASSQLRDELAELIQRNALDLELYQYAFAVQLLDTICYESVDYGVKRGWVSLKDPTGGDHCGFVGLGQLQSDFGADSKSIAVL